MSFRRFKKPLFADVLYEDSAGLKLKTDKHKRVRSTIILSRLVIQVKD